MATDAEIRTALDRARQAIELRPAMASGTMAVKVHLGTGVRCVSQMGDWSLEMDEPASVGGDNTAPSPGFYGCSALGGCLAISIKFLAAQAELAIDKVDVEIHGDYDERGFFGIDDIAPGYLRFRVNIDVSSPADPESVRKIVDQACERSSWASVFGRPQDITFGLSVNNKAA